MCVAYRSISIVKTERVHGVYGVHNVRISENNVHHSDLVHMQRLRKRTTSWLSFPFFFFLKIHLIKLFISPTILALWNIINTRKRRSLWDPGQKTGTIQPRFFFFFYGTLSCLKWLFRKCQIFWSAEMTIYWMKISAGCEIFAKWLD